MQLPSLLDEYGIEIEADFQQYYQLDLLGLYRGEFSMAKAYRLIRALPSESRFIREISQGKADWTVAEHLLASAVDTLQAANWQRGGGKGSRPKPLPRPGTGKKETRIGNATRTPAEIKQYLAELRAGKVKKG